MNLKELREKRAKLVSEIKQMAETIQKESRDFKAEEREKWDKLNAEVDGMGDQIKSAERVNDLDAEMSRSVNEGRILPGRGDTHDSTHPNAGGFSARMTFETKSGDRVPCIGPEARMADVFRNRFANELPDGIEPEELSLQRLVRAAALGDWSQSQSELRAMGQGTGAGGGFFVPSVLSMRVIDAARNKARVIQAGAGTIPMDSSELTLVKVTGDPTAYWREEHAEITESDMTLAPVILRAKTIGCLVRSSIELIEDADNFVSTLENSMASALALEIDRVALFGSGVGEPKGLFNHSDLNEQSLGANGAVPTDYNDWSQAVQAIQNANGEPNATIYNPRTAGTLDRLINGNGDPLPPPDSYKNLAKYVTNQIGNTLTQGTSSVASAAFVGDFQQCLFGMRTSLKMKIAETGGGSTGDEAFSRLQVLIRAYMRMDFAILRPTHFTKITGILA